MRSTAFGNASLLVLVGLLSACHARPAPTLDSAVVGPSGGVDDVDFTPYLQVAHAIVTHAPKPEVHPAAHAGQRAFVTFWSPGHAPVRATGLGATLLDSVTLASDAVAKTAVGEGRVQLDILTTAEPTPASDEIREPVALLGTHGYLASDASGHVGFVTPSEIVFDKLADLSSVKNQTVPLFAEKIRATLAERASVAPGTFGAMRLATFATRTHVEGVNRDGKPVSLVRSMPPRGADVTSDRLFAAVRAAADHLASVVDATGRFSSDYDPVADVAGSGDYSLVRHAGAVYAMTEAYGEMRVVAWSTAADRALRYLLANAQRTPDGAYVCDNPTEEQQKVGGTGLTLVALASYQAATGDARNLEPMRELAEFIVHQQYPDGHFRDNADVAAETPGRKGKKPPPEVFFYTGEAILGLLRLHALAPDPRWLAAARKGADWVIDVRDAHDDLAHQVNDHWMSYALHDLSVMTGEKKYADHAFKIARAIEATEPETPLAPDQVGAFYEQGEVAPTSTRLEAVASDIQLARFLGADEAWLRRMAIRYATFTASQQLDAENAWFARNPARALGGVRESLVSNDLRIDFDQHAASGWLRLARELRDPAWGGKP